MLQQLLNQIKSNNNESDKKSNSLLLKQLINLSRVLVQSKL